MGKVNIGRMLTVVTVLAVLCLVFLAAYLTDSNTTNFRELLGVAQSLVTILAIIAGGIFATYKWQIFREFEPHLTITHEVSLRPVGESYVHIAVTATLLNSSRVQIELRKGFFLVQRIAPSSDEEVEALYAQVFIDREFDDIQWTPLVEVQREWGKGEIIVEPGESHPETIEFIVSKSVESVILYTYFFNPTYSSDSGVAQGWGRTSVLDMMEL